MGISKEILLENGWVEQIDTLNYVSYCYSVNDMFYLTIYNDLSNYAGRNWYCHIDNCNFETIASADIETIEHFNNLMKLMDINYEL